MDAPNQYAFKIPGSEPLADENANAHSTDAPAIESGAGRSIGDVTNCMRELKRRKVMKLNPPTLAAVTSDEVSASFVRQVAVASEVASGTYGARLGQPAWAVRMEDRLNQLMNQQKQLTARFDRMEARRFNRGKELDDPLVPLFKVRPGVGPPLPGCQATAVEDAEIGARYPNFPASMNRLNALTRRQISVFAEWSNETFGIVDGDDVSTWRNKFRHFLADS